MVFLHFRTLAAIFEFYMASQSPQSHVKIFLEPVASFSQSLSPFRAMATPFIPNITTFISSYKFLQTQNLVAGPFSLCPDLAIYSPSKFWDPSRLVANALVYRKFWITFLYERMVGELCRFPSENPSKRPISGMGTFGGILPEQYIFRTMYFQNKDPFQFYKPAGWIYEPAG